MARILVAEDDPSVRAFVVSALTMKGHEVVAEEDGGLAAETADAENGRFDLLLSDIKMPIMDGIALALDVAAKYPDIIIVLMTGFADQRERAHGLDALIYDVIVKPFTLADLLAKIDDALAGKPVEVLSLGRQARES
ncbi:response regulator [Devosia sp. J2-20]|jgi:two-component system, cell cycle response regulator CpdR|uniref:Response regulator n=1 Tax=Devosia litorisediminis TaxID=2829817 RepID=A0A942E8A1_9HYPH|nr:MULTISPECIES: response regulator [Devosia]MBS3850093.1 response regulator [Devosia litorisediminis]MCZ4347580.1 response regulator [Devosia neptuniae]WDQ99869.1 response regulator [Devosia sp. J2-20]|tara:strand:- start:73034 stop:73444 length:411 start_codon:yes stop_codon:yes gene_type:complete